MAIELVSFKDLKTLLKLDQSESKYPELTLLQESVVDAIENHLHRFLEKDIYTKTTFVYGKKTLIGLEGFPVEKISKVEVKRISSSIESPNIKFVESDFSLVNFGIKFFAPISEAEVTIKYTGGLEDVPGDIKRAALLQTSYEWQNRDHIGAESVSFDGGFINRPSLQLLPVVRNILDKHIHPILGFN